MKVKDLIKALNIIHGKTGMKCIFDRETIDSFKELHTFLTSLPEDFDIDEFKRLQQSDSNLQDILKEYKEKIGNWYYLKETNPMDVGGHEMKTIRKILGV